MGKKKWNILKLSKFNKRKIISELITIFDDLNTDITRDSGGRGWGDFHTSGEV